MGDVYREFRSKGGGGGGGGGVAVRTTPLDPALLQKH